MNDPKITLARMAGHEYWRALRRISKVVPAKEYIETLVAQRQRAVRGFLGATGLSFAILLSILNASGNSLEFRLVFMDLSIPIPYALFGASFLAFGADVALLNYFFLNTFVGLAVKKLFEFDNSPTLLMHLYGNDAWCIGANVQYRFLKSTKPHSVTTFITLAAVGAPFVAVLVLLHWQLIVLAWSHLLAPSEFPFGRTSSFLSIFIVAFPMFYLLALFVPFRFSKNKFYIRWNVLHRRDHPQAARWLQDP